MAAQCRCPPRRQRVSKISRRSFVIARGKKAHDHVFAMFPDSQQIVEMPPEQFLRLTVQPGRGYGDVLGDVQALENRIENDQEIDPPYLEVDVEQGNRVVAHEGRHRAWAAHRLGLDRIPVVIILRRGKEYLLLDLEPYHRLDSRNPKLLPQLPWNMQSDAEDEWWN